MSGNPLVRCHLIPERDRILELVASKGYGNFITREKPTMRGGEEVKLHLEVAEKSMKYGLEALEKGTSMTSL